MALTFTIFGGGGKVAKHFTKLAVTAGHNVHSVIKDDGHASELHSLGATTHILPLQNATSSTISSLFRQTKPDVVLFSAGAGGKPPGADEIDHKGAVKVFDAMEQAGVKRLILIGALDVRSRDKGWPEWYNEEDKKASDNVWGSIGSYMQAKLDAELNLHTRSKIDYTVIRPGNLTTEPAGGAVMGRTHLTHTSRELVAQTALAIATTPSTIGFTIDVMDGDEKIEDELKKVVKEKLDAWTG
ncbi:hypothetical protein I312_106747 [Cryptococcus bacillisporus CA1280]|uniref:Unplaced genomic scaffold supercont1.23, whole genome shotgun sequence n=1 Tax=Cryptococcus bacillisporus CA1280 TaxID=1296109 RepID=A0A0D0U914_CRYGA|nr:hypothetical protein I312_06091 [Cryptococcus bacillisporus CA1280]